MTSYPDILHGLHLEDSYFLGMTVLGSQLRLHVLFALDDDHPTYAPVEPGERHCYREGLFRCTGVKVISSHGQPYPTLMSDPSGLLDLGTIGYSVERNVHQVKTDWFGLRFTADLVEVLLVVS